MKKIISKFSCIFTILILACFMSSCNKKYTITYMDNYVILDKEEVKKGETAKGFTPVKEGHDFLGWSLDPQDKTAIKNFDNIKEDLKVYAIFTPKTYTVKFYVLGELYDTKTCLYNENAENPERPDIEGYLFRGWDGSYKAVKSDLELHAKMEKLEYNVNFYDYEGNFIETQTIKYQESATAPKLESNEYYEFTGWDKDFSIVTENIDVYATATKVKGKIEYFFGDENLNLTPSTYNIGEGLTLPIPEKTGYYFAGWYLSKISLTEYKEIDKDATGDFQLQAKFIEIEKQNIIKLPETDYHFTEIKKTKHSQGDFYVYQPVIPEGVNSSTQSYTWSTSDSSVATVSQYSSITINSAGYCILTATSKDNPTLIINAVIKTTVDSITVVTEAEANIIEICEVKFVGKDKEVISTTKCIKGGNVIYPAASSYDGYKFIGWDKENYNITSDITIEAQYEFGSNRFNGKSFAVIGDSISTYLNYVPDGFATFYPYPTADVSDYNMTWWMQVINKMGGTLFVNNSYSGSCVSGGSSSATKLMSRLEYTQINGETPDVILIYMGSNDCASSGISSKSFDQDYSIMLENLKLLCPNSEIILLTLCTSPFYSVANQKTFNDIIKAKGEEFNLPVLDLQSASLEGHLVDSAHPKYSGMQVVANKIIEELNKIA